MIPLYFKYEFNLMILSKNLFYFSVFLGYRWINLSPGRTKTAESLW